ncbi:ATP-binding protein [Streptomyces pilosus]|nr:ATP-binding protein [Streptomyces pilosus]GGV71535.1 ATP-binding protein [Streptomyces pilosus]
MNTLSVNVAAARSTASVAGARDSARDFLRSLVPALASEAADTLVLVVCELVTNALRYGGGACTWVLTAPGQHRGGRARRQPAAPRMRSPDLNGGTGGFGWPMVNRLARATVVIRHANGGKTVSALLPR